MTFKKGFAMFRKCVFLIIFLYVLQVKLATSQQNFEIQVTVDNVVKKNFLGIPKGADFTLNWRIMENTGSGLVEAPISRLNNYEVLYAPNDSTFASASTLRPGQVNTVTIPDLDIGDRYYFRVQAIGSNNQLFQSAVVWMQAGKKSEIAGGGEEQVEQTWFSYFPLNGKFPLILLGNAAVYDKATFLGRLAFWVIWWFFLIGIYIWVDCMRYSKLAKIFPFQKSKFKPSIQYEAIFENRKEAIFFGEDGIIDRWKKIIDSTGDLLDKASLIKGEHLDFDRLKITSATWWRDTGRGKIKELLEDINPYCKKYPTARIIRAGLANHEINGYKFMESSQEVDRAIENRAVMEIEKLKGQAKLEWLWNLGATAPLIGLFGTVTGISVSFQNLAMQTQKGGTDSSDKIAQLAGGINEALWTTIFGLSAGIFLVILYYVYKNKMDWIYGKWEEIYVDVSEKL